MIKLTPLAGMHRGGRVPFIAQILLVYMLQGTLCHSNAFYTIVESNGMAKYARLTEAEIHEGIAQTKRSIEGSRTYLTFLANGQGLPRDLLSRHELAESHAKLIAKLEQVVEDLETELNERANGARR
jgi:hypothetical protein